MIAQATSPACMEDVYKSTLPSALSLKTKTDTKIGIQVCHFCTKNRAPILYKPNNKKTVLKKCKQKIAAGKKDVKGLRKFAKTVRSLGKLA